MKQTHPSLTRFSRNLWLTLGTFIVFVGLFAAYVMAEKRIDKANELRLRSYYLASELRASSNELTRLVRTYVVTGDVAYKQRYQEILDIRDGRRPRPAVEGDLLWQPLPSEWRAPGVKGKTAVPLLTLMRQAGVTDAEFEKLALAKANSDALTKTEFEAMRRVESAYPVTNALRFEASMMLHDAEYQRAKAAIMQPIDEFSMMMEERTHAGVRQAEEIATWMRFAFVSFGLMLLLMLRKAYRTLREVLGGPVEEIHGRIAQIGSGDFSEPVPVPPGAENSVLGWLSETQAKLANIDRQHQDAQLRNVRLNRLYVALSQCNQAIVHCSSEAELFPQICQDAVTYGGMKMAWIGLANLDTHQFEVVAVFGNGVEYVDELRVSIDPSDPSSHGPTGLAFRQDEPCWCQDFQHDPVTQPWHTHGARFGWGASAALPLHRHGRVIGTLNLYTEKPDAFDQAEQNLLLEMTTDIDYAIDRYALEAERAQLEEKLRGLYELSPIGIALTDMSGRYVEFNKAFERICGYSDEELRVMDYWKLTPKKYEGEEARQLESLKRTGYYGPYEKEYRRKDGSLVPIRLNGMLLTLRGEEPYIWSLVEDISDRKRTESNQKIAATAFDAEVGIMVTDADNTILRVNRAFTQLTGYTAEELVGQTPRILKSGRHDAAFYAEMWHALLHNGAWEGEIWDKRKSGEIYPKWLTISAVKDSQGGVTHYVSTNYDITERKAAEEEIKQLAFFDPLTKLPNRRHLIDRLQQALAVCRRTQGHGALLFIDLDNFKTLNDTLGHDKGDMLLCQTAERILACLREGDMVARLGGDEFIVMLENLSAQSDEAAAQTESVGQKIIVALNQTYRLAEHEHHGTASAGVTLFDSTTQSIDELMKQADLAMYQAKAAGRNTLRFFYPAMQQAVSSRAALERDLRAALQERQFVLYYQPQVDGEGRVRGAEALLRWKHPERGLVYPGAFIPLAEETGLILSLGSWVVQTACEQLVAWAEHPATAHLHLAVNVSARQIHQPDFADQLLTVLHATGADPRRLKLELTESLFMQEAEDTIQKMNVLKQHGIGFELDDFGTGYSSLSYLKRLPLEKLKIDRSFIMDVLTDPNDAAIAKTIVVLARSLGLDVIAEGVETETQHAFLAQHGCHLYQGYLFSRPLPLEEFERFILEHP